ncbi:uncharacterized protein LOC116302694 isoform X2 [Actinia tenebrosa]|nr:uncharacterized protein LOC116302694 isoform X2 [Actinia tenebrosa]
MMTLSERTRLNILLCLSVILAIFQVITATAVIILFKAYSDLKKKATETETNLSSIETQISLRNEERPETTATTATVESERNSRKWRGNVEESPTRVPTPPQNRRSGYKQEIYPQYYSTEVPRTQSRNSQEMTGFPRDTSFTSARSCDSGTGSFITRTPQSSISCESKTLWQAPIIERGSNEVKDRPISRDSQISQSPFRLSRDTSSEVWRTGSSGSSQSLEDKSRRARREVRKECNEPSNQNELTYNRSSRLHTMAIEMIGLEENGLTNKAYHEGNEDFNKGLKKTAIASEELAHDLNSESQPQIGKNVNTADLNYEKEEIKKKWHKDENEVPTRVPTPPRMRRSKRNKNEVRDRLSSRLETMAIGMIGLEETHAGERKSERLSRHLIQRKEEIGEESSDLNGNKSNVITRF